ncbi:MAG: carbonic anhydrase [Gammaproteobacteria bacterium]|nr:carbonic anhydrase [Gammaproteobacteria bacterium]
MKQSLKKIIKGYLSFRKKYAHGNRSVMRVLSMYGQKPKIMVIACCDSRVDPALILQCDPGDLFVVRNIANIVPPYEKDKAHHGTSAALEFGITVLEVKHLIVLGHSQCGGMQALMEKRTESNFDFITNWVSIIDAPVEVLESVDDCAKYALNESYQHCLTFPWIAERVAQNKLNVHQWFFDISTGQIHTYSQEENVYKPLEEANLIQK